jgi:hypothetical protein
LSASVRQIFIHSDPTKWSVDAAVWHHEDKGQDEYAHEEREFPRAMFAPKMTAKSFSCPSKRWFSSKQRDIPQSPPPKTYLEAERCSNGGGPAGFSFFSWSDQRWGTQEALTFFFFLTAFDGPLAARYLSSGDFFDFRLAVSE